MRNNKGRGKFAVFSILTLLGLVFLGTIIYIGLFQQTFIFDFGFKPYGESPNQITDLNRDYNTEFGGTDNAQRNFYSTSRYWDITQIDREGQTNSQCARAESNFAGHDLSLISATPRNCGTSLPTTETIYVTTEDFQNRIFKVTADSNPKGNTGNDRFYGYTNFKLFLSGSSGERSVIDHNFAQISDPTELNVVISPSIINDRVDVYANGELLTQTDYAGNYKIRIVITTQCGQNGQTDYACGTNIVLDQPSYKQDFGCTVLPSEQYYVAIFNEGSEISLSDLDRFSKFCLDEAPLKVYTNEGSGTDTQALIDLTNGEEFDVPQGQIWSIEYIGEKSNYVTECEADEAYNINDGECLARAVLTFNCPEGSEFNFERGYCTIETEPYQYTFPEIQTHETLETQGRFLFVAITQDGEPQGATSFNIFGEQFSSGQVTYIGSEEGNINFPEDQDNWIVEFSYAGQSQQARFNEKISLSDKLSVTITKIEAFRKSSGALEDYRIDYTFIIEDSTFLDLVYQEGTITLSNTFIGLDGGLTITREDLVGTTEVDSIEQYLPVGKITFSVEVENLRELKARPFIKIDTPQYIYRIDTTNALTVRDFDVIVNSEEITEISGVEFNLRTIAIIFVISIISILGLIILIAFFRKRFS